MYICFICSDNRLISKHRRPSFIHLNIHADPANPHISHVLVKLVSEAAPYSKALGVQSHHVHVEPGAQALGDHDVTDCHIHHRRLAASWVGKDSRIVFKIATNKVVY